MRAAFSIMTQKAPPTRLLHLNALPPSLSLLFCISMGREERRGEEFLFFALDVIALFRVDFCGADRGPTDSLIFRRLLFPLSLQLARSHSIYSHAQNLAYIRRARDDARCTTNSATVHRLCSGEPK